MTVSELKAELANHPDQRITIDLPDGDSVPPHFHVTEVAFSKKDFIDCGGTIRHEGKCLLQIWVADDIDHRVNTTTLTKILVHGAPVLPTDALPVEIEYCLPGLTHLSLEKIVPAKDGVHLKLAHKATDCLAKDVCGIPANSETCTPGSGCC